MKKNLMYLCFLILFAACAAPNKSLQSEYTFSNNVIIKGGDGHSFEKSKVIIAQNSRDGIASEYEYLEKVYGKMQTDWILLSQSLQYNKKKPFDVLKIKLLDTNKELRVFFDITSFFGKY
jgi:hypothetical protein